MKKALLFLHLLLSPAIFSQEISIATNFIENGVLYESVSESSKVLIEFNENDDCTVIGYFGKDIYKVKYKGFEGFLSSDFLEINEEMMDLYYDYQDKERAKLIEERKNRKKKLQEIVYNSKVEKAKRLQDSIAKVEALEKQRLATQELLRKQVAEKAQRQRDSIAKVEAQEKQRLATQELLRKQAAEKAQRQRDSIAKVKALEKQHIEENKKLRSSCKYLINEYDEFYKEQLIRTELYRLNKNLTVELYRQGNKINIFLNLSKSLGCASYLTRNRSSISIQLENDQIVTLYHTWNIDCENFNFKGVISNFQIQKLKESPIKSIKFRGTKNTVDVSDLDYKTVFIDKLQCIE